MLKGFKEFISQGNALELAVAVIIGAAFKPIVDAITKVILDIIGQVVGKRTSTRSASSRSSPPPRTTSSPARSSPPS